MNTEALLKNLNDKPESVSFQQVIETIEENYNYTPARFSNGNTVNEAGSNEGSCKIFAFARLNNLEPEQTLHCFGDYYRKDVLDNPEGTDHANIRNFMQTGWQGVVFDSEALTAK